MTCSLKPVTCNLQNIPTLPKINLPAFRQLLHQYPEVAGHEKETALKIFTALLNCKPSTIIRNVGGYGVVAVFDTGVKGKTILFRADMDALPIDEVNDFEYRSIVKGVSHKCGHDGHSTILLGLAQKLIERPLKKGKTILLFQPAEETGQGAKAVLNDAKFAKLKPDIAFALHNVPGYKKGQIVYRKGAFNPAVISLIIRFKGLKTHAAEQENGINPDIAIAALILKLKSLIHTDVDSPDFCNITTIFTRLGSKDYGTAAGEGELHYTIRCWTRDKLERTKSTILNFVQEICTEQQLKQEIEWLHYFAATANDDYAVDCIANSAKRLNFDHIQKPTPFKWGEDFGLFTEYVAGAMFGLGAGETTPPLHQPDYDFPDEIIPFGVAMFYDIAAVING